MVNCLFMICFNQTVLMKNVCYSLVVDLLVMVGNKKMGTTRTTLRYLFCNADRSFESCFLKTDSASNPTKRHETEVSRKVFFSFLAEIFV